MNLTRRRLMKGSILTLAALGAFASTRSPTMRPAQLEGKILADLHAHLPRCKHYDEEIVLDVLSRQATGITMRQSSTNVLAYDDLLNHSSVKEIDSRGMAEVHWKGQTGYILRAQEIRSALHVLSIGCKYFQDQRDAVIAADAVRSSGGIAILPHPAIVEDPHTRLLDKKGLLSRLHLLRHVDEVEVFNGYSINTILYDFSRANDLALFMLDEAKRQTNGTVALRGIATSDAHHEMDQVGLAGIYLPMPAMTDFDSFAYHVKSGKFERCEGYYQSVRKDRAGIVSKASFMKGAGYTMLGM